MRGVLLRDWADPIRARFGARALAAVRDRAGVSAAELPDAPDLRAWYPAQVQLRVTEAFVDVCLDGEALALGSFLRAVGPATPDRVVRWALTRVGPGPILRGAARAHRHLYDRGEAVATTRPGAAEVRVAGAALFDHPTWRLLQLVALRALLETLGRTERELTVADAAAAPHETGEGGGAAEDTRGPRSTGGAVFRVRWD